MEKVIVVDVVVVVNVVVGEIAGGRDSRRSGQRMFNPWLPPGHLRVVWALARDNAVTATAQAEADLEEDVVAVAAAAAVVAAVATAYLEEASVEGCDVDPEAKSEAPRR